MSFGISIDANNEWCFNSDPMSYVNWLKSKPREFLDFLASKHRFHADALKTLNDQLIDNSKGCLKLGDWLKDKTYVTCFFTFARPFTTLTHRIRVVILCMCIDLLHSLHSYASVFVDGWLKPFCTAVWSLEKASVEEFDVIALFSFLENHNFLTWSTFNWFIPKGK